MRTLWLQCDSGKESGLSLIDLETRTTPVIPEGGSLIVNVGGFRFDSPISFASFSSVELTVRVGTSSGDVLATVEVLSSDDEFNETLSLSAWNHRLAYHAQFELTTEDLTYDLGVEDYIWAWIVVTGYDSDGEETLIGSGRVQMVADNNSPDSYPDRFMLKSDYDADDDGVPDASQPLNARLTSLAGLSSVANLLALAGLSGLADRLAYFTGAGTLSLATLTSYARTLLDDANSTAALATLGIQAGTQSEWEAGIEPALRSISPALLKIAIMEHAAAGPRSATNSSMIGDLDSTAVGTLHTLDTSLNDVTVTIPAEFGVAGQVIWVRKSSDSFAGVIENVTVPSGGTTLTLTLNKIYMLSCHTDGSWIVLYPT